MSETEEYGDYYLRVMHQADEPAEITRLAETLRAARGSWVGGGDNDFDRHLARAVIAAREPQPVTTGGNRVIEALRAAGPPERLARILDEVEREWNEDAGEAIRRAAFYFSRFFLRETVQPRDESVTRTAAISALLAEIEANDPSADGTDDAPDAEARYTTRNALIQHLMGAVLEAGWPCGYDTHEVIVKGIRQTWPVAFVELPTGQVSWHIAPYTGRYDGHTTRDKYARCAALRATHQPP